ncbi:MAG: Rrf2 family transcriptional regulator [Candidatus Kapabacteria bacterium]|nr:Rrf2 family transcriptional regulator [Candidatus Kapabacteria bacterium]
MLSNACAYGLRAMMYLARQPQMEYTAIDEVASAVHLPKAFLRKIMNKLVRAGLVESVRGAGGGVRLLREPSNIRVYEIVLAVDGDKRFTRCMLHFDQCNSEEPCAFHAEWAKQRTMIQERLQALSLKEVAETMRKFYLDA